MPKRTRCDRDYTYRRGTPSDMSSNTECQQTVFGEGLRGKKSDTQQDTKHERLHVPSRDSLRRATQAQGVNRRCLTTE